MQRADTSRFREPSISARLLMMALAVLVPAMLAALWVMGSIYQRERQAVQRTIRETTRALALVVDRELARTEAVAWTLAASPSLAAHDYATFYSQAKLATASSGAWVVVFDGDGMLLNTAAAFGASLPRRGASGRRVPLADGTASISDLFTGPVGGEPIVAVSVPAKAAGPGFGLSVTLRPAQLQRLIEQQRIPAGWTAAVIDRRGTVVARHPNPAKWMGKPAPADALAKMRNSAEGLFQGTTLDGEPVAAFYSKVPGNGWTFVIGVPSAQFGANMRRSVLEAAAVSVLLLVLAVIVAAAVGRRIAQPARRLQEAAQALKAGERVTYSATGVREFDIAGATLVEASARLREAHQVFENRIAAAVAETRQAQERAASSQRLEALGRLTGGVAHDVNNILAVVANNAVLIKRMPPGASLDAPLAAIVRAVDTGRQLTQKLLSFARRRTPRPQAIDLREWLPAAVPLLRTSLRDGVTVRLHVAQDVHAIEVDVAELELALLNLAVNANDAMAGGGTLTVSARNAAGPGGAGAVVIAVQDTGEGIAPEALPRVFEPFFTTKREGMGSGLGLSQVYGFCEQAGGAAQIESVPGRGTVVSMRLPASSALPARAPLRAETPPARDKRLLYVEDNVELADATRAVLATFGYRVEWVPDSGEALRRLARERFDIVLSDVVMPGPMNGVELGEHLRAARPDLPVVLVSGYTDDAQRAVTAGFEVLQKPCMPDELAATLARVETITRARA